MALFFGQPVFQAVGLTMPEFMKEMQESKIMYILGAFIVTNMISGQLRATGAFEIEVNNETVYSKLETGKMADAHELHSLFNQYGVSFMQ